VGLLLPGFELAPAALEPLLAFFSSLMHFARSAPVMVAHLAGTAEALDPLAAVGLLALSDELDWAQEAVEKPRTAAARAAPMSFKVMS
jgi:hypothetical protein